MPESKKVLKKKKKRMGACQRNIGAKPGTIQATKYDPINSIGS